MTILTETSCRFLTFSWSTTGLRFCLLIGIEWFVPAVQFEYALIIKICPFYCNFIISRIGAQKLSVTFFPTQISESILDFPLGYLNDPLISEFLCHNIYMNH